MCSENCALPALRHMPKGLLAYLIHYYINWLTDLTWLKIIKIRICSSSFIPQKDKTYWFTCVGLETYRGTERAKVERTLTLMPSLRCWMLVQYKERIYVVHTAS